jgi:biopolymer transport protein ExbB
VRGAIAATGCAPELDRPEEESSVDGAGTWSTYLQNGGLVLWLLVALAMVALLVAIERLIALARARINVNEFLAKVRKALITNRSIREAVKICEQYGGPVASIVKAGLLKYGQPREHIEKTIENAALFERGRLERFLPVLAAVARVAPLLGFLGTVLGTIQSLDALAAAGPSSPGPGTIGLQQALAKTAAGLAIAIPTYVVHQWLTGRIDQSGRDIQTATNMLMETFGEMERGAGATDGGAVAEPAREVVSR